MEAHALEVERRAARRVETSLYVNRYIDGQPFACEVMEISETGMLLRRILEPEAPRAVYAMELAIQGEDERLWLCAAPVWSAAGFEAVQFVAQSSRDKKRLRAMLDKVGDALPAS